MLYIATLGKFTRAIFILLPFTVSSLFFSMNASAGPCIAAYDNGTIEMPPLCDYTSNEKWQIINGLPVGTTIDIDIIMGDFYNIVENIGGTLGGTVSTFETQINLTLTGTGALAGFNRSLNPVLAGIIHSAPKNPDNANQDFATTFFSLQANVIGDPDFDLLSIIGGDDKGLPSPGHTTLTQIGGPFSDFYVDSFFDINYQINFVGAPGSVLEGFSGTTSGEGRIQTEVQVPEPTSLAILALGLIGLCTRRYRH